MPNFDPPDPNFEARVRESFERQRVMETIGARLKRVEPGGVEIELPFRHDLTQQHGYLHAGIVTTVVDSACGYAAMSLTPPGAEIVSVEFKINLLSPATGDLLVARALVKRAGRNITVCAGDAFMSGGAQEEKLVATMLATMMTVRGRA
ncbi:MAG: PaaI family thioesterase [Acidobacteria bacterium]|nr:PaaI family thioesterase [Acidobacteriota bacterium]